MKAVVTGGAGYLGSTLVPALLGRGWRVVVFDSLRKNQQPRGSLLDKHEFEFIRGDIRDRAALASACQDADVLFHLAAIPGYPACAREP